MWWHRWAYGLTPALVTKLAQESPPPRGPLKTSFVSAKLQSLNVVIPVQLNGSQPVASSDASHPSAAMLLGAGTSFHGPPLTEYSTATASRWYSIWCRSQYFKLTVGAPIVRNG